MTGVSTFNAFFLLCPPLQCDDGERVPIQGTGILSSSQTSEHKESGQMVSHLEGQAQVAT